MSRYVASAIESTMAGQFLDPLRPPDQERATRFARIESEKDLENFKRDYGRSVGYPGFFPQEFWNSWTFVPRK